MPDVVPRSPRAHEGGAWLPRRSSVCGLMRPGRGHAGPLTLVPAGERGGRVHRAAEDAVAQESPLLDGSRGWRRPARASPCCTPTWSHDEQRRQHLTRETDKPVRPRAHASRQATGAQGAQRAARREGL